MLNTHTTTILDQILMDYYGPHYYSVNRLTKDQAICYFGKLLEDDNIVYLTRDGQLTAWMETWYITEEQMKRVVNYDKFLPENEDIKSGDIAFIADLYINPSVRGNIRTIFKLKRLAEEVKMPRVILLEEFKNKQKFRTFRGGLHDIN